MQWHAIRAFFSSAVGQLGHLSHLRQNSDGLNPVDPTSLCAVDMCRMMEVCQAIPGSVFSIPRWTFTVTRRPIGDEKNSNV